MPAFEVFDQYGAFQRLTDAPDAQTAIVQAASQDGMEPDGWTAQAPGLPAPVPAAATRPAAPAQTATLADGRVVTFAPLVTDPAELARIRAECRAQPRRGQLSQDEIDAMALRASMRDVHLPPEPVVRGKRNRARGERRYRAVLWDPVLYVSTHLGMCDTMAEKLALEEAARQRRAMGLPIRM